MGIKEENISFQAARIKEKENRNLDYIRCMKREDQKVLVMDNNIKEMWINILKSL